MLGKHKREIEDLEEKLKKAESARDKLEKSKEEAIQALNDKVKTLQEGHAEEIQSLKTDQNAEVQRNIFANKSSALATLVDIQKCKFGVGMSQKRRNGWLIFKRLQVSLRILLVGYFSDTSVSFVLCL